MERGNDYLPLEMRAHVLEAWAPIPPVNTYFPPLWGYDPDNRSFEDVVDFIPHYTVDRDRIEIDDPIYREHSIERSEGHNAVLVELAKHPAVMRLQYIEQLTTDDRTSTIPNMSHFSRWEHVWGSVVQIRQLCEKHELDPSSYEAVKLQLRTLLSDVAHTAFSHLGDFIKQGYGGKENAHDLELMEYLEATGLNELLRHFQFKPEEVVFPEGEDFVECPSPDNNTDRYDYTLRQLRRFPLVGSNYSYGMVDWTNAVELLPISDGKLDRNGTPMMVFKPEYLKAASLQARGALLLPLLHFQHPAHRVQIIGLDYLVRRCFTEGHSLYSDWAPIPQANQKIHPYDLMMTVDQDFLNNRNISDEFLLTLKPILMGLGRESRFIFVTRIQQYLSQLVDPLDFDIENGDSFSYIKYRGLPKYASNLEVLENTRPEQVPDFGENPYTIDFHFTPLKARSIDPLCRTVGNDIVRLSEIDKGFARLRTEQAELLSHHNVTRLAVSPDTREIILRGMREVDEQWGELLKRERATKEEIRAIQDSARMLGGSSLVQMCWLD